MQTTDLLTVSEVAHRSGFAAVGAAVLRARGPARRDSDVRRPAPLPAQRAAAAGVHPGRAQRRAVARGDRRRPGHPAGRSQPDEGRLDAAVALLARAARRPDRRAEQAARRAGLVHRLRLPVAEDVRDVQPRRPGRDGRRRRRVPPALRRCQGATSGREAVDDLGAGRSASADDGNASLERRRPLPITTTPRSRTARSTSTGQDGGRPIGVMPPYSIPDSSTASAIGAKEALRASRRRRTTPLTSARVVASTTHAA